MAIYKINADNSFVSSWDVGPNLEKDGNKVIFNGKIKHNLKECFWLYDSKKEKTSFRLGKNDTCFCWFDGEALTKNDLKNWKEV